MSSRLGGTPSTFPALSTGLAFEPMQPLAERVRGTREAMSLSHARLSVRMGGSPSAQSIINIEKHGQVPKADVLRALAEGLDVSADYLLGLTDDPTPAADSAARRVDGAIRVAQGS